MGSAIAYFLAGRSGFKGSVLVVEKDPTYAACATARSAGGLGLANEGWPAPYSLLQDFRRKARSLGVTYLKDEIIGVTRSGSRVAGAVLAEGGAIACGALVDCAGVRAAEIAAMAGLELPV